MEVRGRLSGMTCWYVTLGRRFWNLGSQHAWGVLARSCSVGIFLLLPQLGCGKNDPVIPDALPGEAPSGFVTINPGPFIMGSPRDEPGRGLDEMQHPVELTQPYWMAETEVTNQQFASMAQWALDNGYAVTNGAELSNNLDESMQVLLDGLSSPDAEIVMVDRQLRVVPGREDRPVRAITWYGAIAYCDWLSLREGIERAYDHSTGSVIGGNPYEVVGYRLPTEAEWEYACRAGTSTAFAGGPLESLGCGGNPGLERMAWYCGNSSDGTKDVGGKEPNAWGLYDMHGNVGEWCQDWKGEYPSAATTNPVGSSLGTFRVVRGGFFDTDAEFCRSAYRSGGAPDQASIKTGFRPVRGIRARDEGRVGSVE